MISVLLILARSGASCFKPVPQKTLRQEDCECVATLGCNNKNLGGKQAGEGPEGLGLVPACLHGSASSVFLRISLQAWCLMILLDLPSSERLASSGLPVPSNGITDTGCHNCLFHTGSGGSELGSSRLCSQHYPHGATSTAKVHSVGSPASAYRAFCDTSSAAQH